MEDITKYVWFQEGPGVRKEQYTNSGVKLLNVANLVDGKVDLSTSDRFISKEEAYGRYKHFLVDEGDLIIASSGIQVSYFDKKMGFIQNNQLPLCMNTSTIRFKSLDKNVTNIRYFMYFLKSALFKRQLQKQITGSAQLNFGPSHLKKMKINMPSIEKQNKIVEKLDKIQKIIDLRNKQLNMLKEVVKSQFVEMFGDININNKNWNSSMLKEHIKVIGGYAFKSKEFKKEGIPILRIGNINTGHFIPKDLKFWSKDDKLVQYEILPGDLVISLTGTTGKDDYGNACIMNNAYPLYYLNQRNAKLNLQKSVNKYYLEYALKIPEIKKRLTGISRGVRQANIANKDIENLILPIPPIELQNKFAEIVKQIDKQKFEIENSLKEMQELYESLMEKYFG